MPKEVRTRPVTAPQARAYLGKAEEFLAAARTSLEAGQSIAATSLAIHAGISACDAICGARTGQRVAASDHGQSATLLEQAGDEGKDAARVLTRLVPLKNRTEYEPEDVPEATAKRAVSHAEKIVVIARTVVT